jgi:hypothetical protein
MPTATQFIGRPDLAWGQWGQGLLSDWWETSPDLVWPNSIVTFSRMRHDPQLRSVLRACMHPILRANWRVDPAGCRDEVVQLCSDDLGVPVLGVDRPMAARRRGVIWRRHLRQAFGHLEFGHMPFERRYDASGPRTRLLALGQRMPWTIANINMDEQSQITSVVQTTQQAPLPANRLVWYVMDQEGANWAGISLMRAAYGAWLLKHETWRVHATSIRRFGMGVPTVKAPQGGTPGQVAEARNLAAAVRAGDQAGVGLPYGFDFELAGLTGSVPDALAFIQYLDQQMAKQALAGVLDLGQTETGSRALGESFLDLFLLALQSLADEMAVTATSGHPNMPGILTDLVDQNWGEDEPVPNLVCTDIGEDRAITAEAISTLVGCGALEPDPNLDRFVRDNWHLPERDPSVPWYPPQPKHLPRQSTAAPDAVEGPGGVGPADAGSQVAAGAPAVWKPRRQITAAEAQAGFDGSAYRQGMDAALAQLGERYGEVRAAGLRDDLVAEVTRLAGDRDLPGLAAISVDASAGAGVIATAMEAMARAGMTSAQGEALHQGVHIALPAPPPADQLGAVAQARALLAAGYDARVAGQRAIAQVAAAGGEQVGAAVRKVLEGLSPSGVRDQLWAALQAAWNAGRMRVMEAAPASAGTAVYYATEYLDDNTCTTCVQEDGAQFESLAAARKAYTNGGYIGCLAGLRCRGTVIAVWGGASSG